MERLTLRFRSASLQQNYSLAYKQLGLNILKIETCIFVVMVLFSVILSLYQQDYNVLKYVGISVSYRIFSLIHVLKYKHYINYHLSLYCILLGLLECYIVIHDNLPKETFLLIGQTITLYQFTLICMTDLLFYTITIIIVVGIKIFALYYLQ